MVQIPAFFRLPIRLNYDPPIQEAVVTTGSNARPARQEARTMRQDPLITYSSLIPGGLHYIPCGFDPPAHKRIRPEGLRPEPASPGSTLTIGTADDAGARLRKIYAALYS